MPSKITVFDGARCIGGNKIHLEFDGNGVFFDFGTNYKKIGDFYEEFLMAFDCNNDLKDRWCTCPQGREIEFKDIKPARDNLGFDFKAFEVDHSIYGATAYAVDTSDGWIVYTGDLRLHGRFRDKTEKYVKEAKSLDPKMLIIEGTRIGRQESKESENEVHSTCLKATVDEKGLVVADFSPRNFERLDTFMSIAKESGRKLVVLAKDAYMLDIMKCADGRDRMSELLVYRDVKIKRDGFEKMVHEKFRGQLRDPVDIAKAPEQYIMCFSFWDVKHLLDIKPAGGTYIYSSSEAYTEEQVIDFGRLWNWMKFFDLRVKGFGFDNSGKLAFDKGYHASGHASAAELLTIIEDIDPEIVLPVHTEDPEFFVNNLKGYDIVLAEEGKRIEVN